MPAWQFWHSGSNKFPVELFQNNLPSVGLCVNHTIQQQQNYGKSVGNWGKQRLSVASVHNRPFAKSPRLLSSRALYCAQFVKIPRAVFPPLKKLCLFCKEAVRVIVRKQYGREARPREEVSRAKLGKYIYCKGPARSTKRKIS